MILRYSPEEPIGIKDRGLLSSSVQRMNHSAFGEDAYITVFEKAAALFHSLINNHCFINANKRTVYGALQLFLARNGFALELESSLAIELCVRVATEQMDIQQLANDIEINSSPL
ncbi:type II toxin-antitoxin system death-on-curing family toxin [Exiguobacterium sp. SL-10]|nr:type II toxin-antitoxin system death-on-curing family toxin [Exiguobacterium sp. SL-10]